MSDYIFLTVTFLTAVGFTVSLLTIRNLMNTLQILDTYVYKLEKDINALKERVDVHDLELDDLFETDKIVGQAISQLK